MAAGSSRGVQQHEISAAADALVAQQLRPTVERVRMALGRGSPNTIGPMLERWFAGLAPRLGLAESADSQAVPAEVLHAAQGLWAAALDRAAAQVHAKLAAERERLASLAGQLEADEKALAARERASNEREQLRQAAVERAERLHDEAKAQISRLETALKERDEALAEANSAIARATHDRESVARESAARLDTLSAELARLRERAEGNERRLLEELDRARQETKTAQKSAGEAARALHDARATSEQQRAELAEQVRDLELERATLAERLAAGERRARELDTQLRAIALGSGGTPPSRRRVGGAKTGGPRPVNAIRR